MSVCRKKKSIKLNEREEIGVEFSFILFPDPRTPVIAIKTLFDKQNLSLVLMYLRASA